MSNDIVEKFVDASIKYDEAIKEGNAKKANKYSSMVRTIRKRLKDSGQLNLLISSMEHENDYVKLNVACSLIYILPNESKEVLKRLTQKKGLPGFEAQIFLREWQEGNIKI